MKFAFANVMTRNFSVSQNFISRLSLIVWLHFHNMKKKIQTITEFSQTFSSSVTSTAVVAAWMVWVIKFFRVRKKFIFKILSSDSSFIVIHSNSSSKYDCVVFSSDAGVRWVWEGWGIDGGGKYEKTLKKFIKTYFSHRHCSSSDCVNSLNMQEEKNVWIFEHFPESERNWKSSKWQRRRWRTWDKKQFLVEKKGNEWYPHVGFSCRGVCKCAINIIIYNKRAENSKANVVERNKRW